MSCTLAKEKGMCQTKELSKHHLKKTYLYLTKGLSTSTHLSGLLWAKWGLLRLESGTPFGAILKRPSSELEKRKRNPCFAPSCFLHFQEEDFSS